MDIKGWNDRYLAGAYDIQKEIASPTPLLAETATGLKPGKVLDLACGTGRNALWLAARGWQVTAVDGSFVAIDKLRNEATAQSLSLDTQVADLQAYEFTIKESEYHLITIAYYLQRNLFEPAKCGVVPGGIVLAIVHISEPGEPPKETRLERGELIAYLRGWEILHHYEGASRDPQHRRAVAEIVARRPGSPSVE